MAEPIRDHTKPRQYDDADHRNNRHHHIGATSYKGKKSPNVFILNSNNSDLRVLYPEWDEASRHRIGPPID